MLYEVITIYLKIARNVFFNLDGSILIWLYKNRSITEEASFNAVITSYSIHYTKLYDKKYKKS